MRRARQPRPRGDGAKNPIQPTACRPSDGAAFIWPSPLTPPLRPVVALLFRFQGTNPDGLLMIEGVRRRRRSRAQDQGPRTSWHAHRGLAAERNVARGIPWRLPARPSACPDVGPRPSPSAKATIAATRRRPAPGRGSTRRMWSGRAPRPKPIPLRPTAHRAGPRRTTNSPWPSSRAWFEVAAGAPVTGPPKPCDQAGGKRPTARQSASARPIGSARPTMRST